MKKIILFYLIVLSCFCMSSCHMTDYLVTAEYNVHYPNEVKQEVSKTIVTSSKNYQPKVIGHSNNGTNYLSVTTYDEWDLSGKDFEKLHHVVSNTAPLELINYKVEKAKEKGKRNKSNSIDDIY